MKKIRLKVATIVKFQDKILLIKEKYLNSTDYKWNIGTGSYDMGDGDIANTSIREIKEETNLDIELKGFYRVVMAKKEDRIKVYFVFVAEAPNDQVVLSSEVDQDELGERIIDYKWASSEEILAMSDDEFVTSTIASVIKEYLQNEEIYPMNLIGYSESEMTN